MTNWKLDKFAEAAKKLKEYEDSIYIIRPLDPNEADIFAINDKINEIINYINEKK